MTESDTTTTSDPRQRLAAGPGHAARAPSAWQLLALGLAAGSIGLLAAARRRAGRARVTAAAVSSWENEGGMVAVPQPADIAPVP